MKNVRLTFPGVKQYKYPLRLGSGVLPVIPEILRTIKPVVKSCILYDTNLVAIAEEIRGYQDMPAIAIPSGEHDKSLEQIKRIYEDLAFKNIQQNDILIVIGGGRTLDIGGFVAHTYRSGLQAMYIPTNLLALTDSCIGGKAYINVQKAKNLLGVEHHPIAIIGDIHVIQQSPVKQIAAGLVEIIKHALLADEELFGWIEENIDRILEREKKILSTLAERAIQLRYDSVLRANNNPHSLSESRFGHIVGHAIESLSSFSISHTEAVSIGMCAELRMVSHPETKRIEALLKHINQPINIPLAIRSNHLWELMRVNSTNNFATIIVPTAIGTCDTAKITFEQLAKARD